MWFWTRLLSLPVCIAAAILAVLLAGREKPGVVWIATQLTVALVVEIIGIVTMFSNMENGLVYNVYTLVEYGTLVFWAVHWQACPRTYAWILLVFGLLTATVEMSIAGPFRIMFISYTAMAIVLAALNIRMLWRRIEVEVVQPFRSPVFVIASAHIFQFAGTTMLMAPLVVLTRSDRPLMFQMWGVLQILSIVRYILVAYGVSRIGTGRSSWMES